MPFQNAETQRRRAWKKYYEAKTTAHQDNLDVLRAVAPEAVSASVPTPHAEGFQKMVASVRGRAACAACGDIVATADVQFAPCGHHFHKTCYDAAARCNKCGKKIFPRKIFTKKRAYDEGGRDDSFSAFAKKPK